MVIRSGVVAAASVEFGDQEFVLKRDAQGLPVVLASTGDRSFAAGEAGVGSARIRDLPSPDNVPIGLGADRLDWVDVGGMRGADGFSDGFDLGNRAADGLSLTILPLIA